MKQTTIALAIALTLATAFGCHPRMEEENLSDADRLEVLDIKIDRHPKDAGLRYRRAQVYLNMQRAKDAVYDMERAVEADPDNVDYRLLQADAYFANGQLENSYKTLTEAERLAPNNLQVQLKIGEITYYSRDYDRSLKHLTAVTEKEPDNRTALFMKSFIYKEKGDTTNAVGLLRRVCDLYTDYEPAYEELGVLYASRQNPLAVEYLNTALRLEPSNTNAMYALAMYYQDLGQFDQAETLYHQILSVNPQSSDAWHNLGYIELTHYHDYARAVGYFDSALAAEPEMAAALANRQLAIDAMK